MITLDEIKKILIEGRKDQHPVYVIAENSIQKLNYGELDRYFVLPKYIEKSKGWYLELVFHGEDEPSARYHFEDCYWDINEAEKDLTD